MGVIFRWNHLKRPRRLIFDRKGDNKLFPQSCAQFWRETGVILGWKINGIVLRTFIVCDMTLRDFKRIVDVVYQLWPSVHRHRRVQTNQNCNTRTLWYEVVNSENSLQFRSKIEHNFEKNADYSLFLENSSRAVVVKWLWAKIIPRRLDI